MIEKLKLYLDNRRRLLLKTLSICSRRYAVFFVENANQGFGTLISTGIGNCFDGEQGKAFLIYPGEKVSYEADKTEPWYYMWIGFRGYRCEGYDEFCAQKLNLSAAKAAE